ncbi:MAG: hypothetical protein A2381_06000 [Bdellovibrionales bacterium RIFOXYB1_FULL_37_110]|nr:MAG: hypothetical protein A2417_04885 [Bdellovibrionales bacterium RIFOXYC1_FULL_37_79]OFZ59373.1 MAG: hypothetical protein A2381_06000 [Bdellovibrionales bacterium RIFOXYB1_FULL_37_110]OFZ61933.1 MAG: hypothetical protein A2577_17885 [Bdellovibrionales bacterium RIFOXYD1_FULL_36_51]
MFKLWLMLMVMMFGLADDYALAFDKNGHRIIAKIAALHLDPSSKIKLKDLIGNKLLEEISNWPDEIKSDELLASPQQNWHYINLLTKNYQKLKSDETYEKYFKQYPALSYAEIQSKIKPDYQKLKGDLIWAIDTFRNILNDKRKTKNQRAEALFFLVHFIGDLHQPLHCGYAHDRGGNETSVLWHQQKTNLHAIWDSEMIEMSKLSYTEYVQFIYKKEEMMIAEITKGDVLDWAYESVDMRDSFYELVKNAKYQGKYKEYKYHYDFVKILNNRLVFAGIRLSKIINDAL